MTGSGSSGGPGPASGLLLVLLVLPPLGQVLVTVRRIQRKGAASMLEMERIGDVGPLIPLVHGEGGSHDGSRRARETSGGRSWPVWWIAGRLIWFKRNTRSSRDGAVIVVTQVECKEARMVPTERIAPPGRTYMCIVEVVTGLRERERERRVRGWTTCQWKEDALSHRRRTQREDQEAEVPLTARSRAFQHFCSWHSDRMGGIDAS
jgi:hypothetical protein